MRNKYLKLTKDQKARDVIMSAQMKASDGSAEPSTIKEVFHGEDDCSQTMDRLRDASFFSDSPWDVNEIRT